MIIDNDEFKRFFYIFSVAVSSLWCIFAVYNPRDTSEYLREYNCYCYYIRFSVRSLSLRLVNQGIVEI